MTHENNKNNPTMTFTKVLIFDISMADLLISKFMSSIKVCNSPWLPSLIVIRIVCGAIYPELPPYKPFEYSKNDSGTKIELILSENPTTFPVSCPLLP